VDDRSLFDEAEAALKQEGSATPLDDEIKSRASPELRKKGRKCQSFAASMMHGLEAAKTYQLW
jgi:hypothetical protein